MHFKNMLKIEREKRTLRKYEIADLMGVSRSTYCKWERGHTPSEKDRKKIRQWFLEHPIDGNDSSYWPTEKIIALYKFSGVCCQDEFSEMLGPSISQPTVSNWLRGLYPPHPEHRETLHALAKRIGFTWPPDEKNEVTEAESPTPSTTHEAAPSELKDSLELVIKNFVEGIIERINKAGDDAITRINAAGQDDPVPTEHRTCESCAATKSNKELVLF